MNPKYWIPAIAMIIVIVLLCVFVQPAPKYTRHKCIDPTHETCDGKCECDGLGCAESMSGHWETDTDGVQRYYTPGNKKAIQFINAYDYQLDISTIPDSIIVMDGNRYVGTLPMWDNSPLDSLLLEDNE